MVLVLPKPRLIQTKTLVPLTMLLLLVHALRHLIQLRKSLEKLQLSNLQAICIHHRPRCLSHNRMIVTLRRQVLHLLNLTQAKIQPLCPPM